MNRTIITTAIALAFSANAFAADPLNRVRNVTGDNTQTMTANNNQAAAGAAAHDNSTANQDNSTTDNSGQNSSTGDASAMAAASAAANNGGTATSNMSDSFNVSSATATSSLVGTVSGNAINRIGNVASSNGNKLLPVIWAGTGWPAASKKVGAKSVKLTNSCMR